MLYLQYIGYIYFPPSLLLWYGYTYTVLVYGNSMYQLLHVSCITATEEDFHMKVVCCVQ